MRLLPLAALRRDREQLFYVLMYRYFRNRNDLELILYTLMVTNKIVFYRDDLLAAGGGEAAVVSVEGGHILRQQVLDGKGLQLKTTKMNEVLSVMKTIYPVRLLVG
jgi:hypothetical protein